MTTEEKIADLPPCPFCGGSDLGYGSRPERVHEWAVECLTCGAIGPSGTGSGAIAARNGWSDRAPATATGEGADAS